ncbi:hypothetical protein GCM10029992_42420 [Glycomyces albus]
MRTFRTLARRLAALTVGALTLTLLGTAPANADPVGESDYAATAVHCDHGEWRGIGSSYTFMTVNTKTDNEYCHLSPGDHNWGVVALQNTLIECYRQDIALDGRYGPATKAALINAQTWERARGKDIAVDGLYGPQSRKAMEWPYYKSRDHGLGSPTFCGTMGPTRPLKP